MSNSLYDIGTRYAAFFDMMEECSTEQEQAVDEEVFFESWLAIDGELEEKLDSSAKWIKSQGAL